MKKSSLTTFGEHIRTLREEAELPLRKVAIDLNIDPSLLGKIERNESNLQKTLLNKLQFSIK